MTLTLSTLVGPFVYKLKRAVALPFLGAMALAIAASAPFMS